MAVPTLPTYDVASPAPADPPPYDDGRERGAAAWPRSGLRLTRDGLAVGATGGVALLAGAAAGYPGLAGLGGGLLVLVVTAVLGLLAEPRLRVERSSPAVRVARLGSCTVRLRVTNAGPRAARALTAQDRVGGRLVPLAVPDLAPGASAELEVELPVERRGAVDVGPLVLHRRGLAGLAVRSSTAGGALSVLVVPRRLACRALPPGARRGQVGAEERVALGGTDLVGLRDYVPGDDLRRLHWATSARTGTLVVREDADPALARLTVVLDVRPASYPAAPHVDLAEEAADAAASLVAVAVASGHPCRLVLLGGVLDVEVHPPGAAVVDADALLGPLLDDLATHAATAVDPGPPALADADVLVVVTGAGSDPAATAPLLDRAAVGVLLVADPQAGAASERAGLVLRGARAEDLLDAWDRHAAH